MSVALAILALAAIILLAFDWWLRRPSDCQIVCQRTDRTPWRSLPAAVGQCRWRCEFTIRNTGRRDQGCLADASGEVRWLGQHGHALPSLTTRVQVMLPAASKRKDGYVPVVPILPGQAEVLQVEVVVTGAASDLQQLLAGVLRLRLQVYGRRTWESRSVEAVLPVGMPAQRPEPVLHNGYLMQPIPTHLLSEQDDLVSVVEQYVAPFAEPGDVVALSESAVAIAQGRYYSPGEIKPGFWANRLCRCFPSYGSLGTQYGLEVLMREEGTARVIAAAVVGFVAKLFRRPGWFYRLAGPQARLVDDLVGTLPPFDKYIVLGPKDPQKVVDLIHLRTGLEAAIVDANNENASHILAATPRVDARRLNEALRRNPHGNNAEQTPIVLVRCLERSVIGDSSDALEDRHTSMQPERPTGGSGRASTSSQAPRP